ncbi:MAG: ECF transporter S component [Clostridia bacterium]|jgi:riboflavin transporter FmnP|nr:ECF transporter S component [Clostridia bacterium]
MKKANTYRIASIGILSALSLVIIFAVPTFKIFPQVPFLEFDFADIPIFIAALVYGPLTALTITLVVCFVQGITISAISGIMGILMHFVATGSFVLVAGLIHKRFYSIKGAIAALAGGILTWNIVMVPFNILITPIFLNMFYGMPKEAIYDYLVPFIIPFNLIKSSVNAVITIILYRCLFGFFNKIAPQRSVKAKAENTDPDRQAVADNATDNDPSIDK